MDRLLSTCSSSHYGWHAEASYAGLLPLVQDDCFGQRCVLSLLPLLSGTIILTAAEHEAMLYVGRVILGFGVGFAIQVRQAPGNALSRRCFAGEPASMSFCSCWPVC